MSEVQIDNGTFSNGSGVSDDKENEVGGRRRGSQSAGADVVLHHPIEDASRQASLPPAGGETSTAQRDSKLEEKSNDASSSLSKEIRQHGTCAHQGGKSDDARHRFNRRGLMVCSSLFTFFYVGSFFGWGPMQLLLEENGAFRWKCDPNYDPDEVCPAQTSTLLNVQLIASVTQLVSPIMGQAIDHYGAPKCACFASGCLAIGLLLLTLSSATSSPAWDRVLFAANGFIAMTTWMGGQLTVQVGMYFAGHTKSRAIFLLNSLFDGGSVTYLFLWWVAQVGSLSLTAVAGGYLVLGALLSVVSMYFWFSAVPEHDEEAMMYGIVDRPVESQTDAEEENANLPPPSTEALVVSSVLVGDIPTTDVSAVDDREVPGLRDSGAMSDHASLTGDVEGPSRDVHERRVSDSKDGNAVTRRNVSFCDVGETEEKQSASPENDVQDRNASSTAAPAPYVLVANRSVKEQLLSQPYLLLCLFFSLHVTMNMWTLATMRDFLAYLGDNELDNRYLTIFTLLLPASIVAVPLVDFIVLRFGFTGGFQSINVLALGYSIIRLATTNLNVQIVGFALFSFYRCFLFGITFSFLPQLLKSTLVGKGYGLVFLLTGIVNVIQIPLAHLAVQQLGGNFFIPNLVFTFLIVPCIAAAWGLGRCIRRESTAKQRLRASYGGGVLVDVEKLDSTVHLRQP